MKKMFFLMFILNIYCSCDNKKTFVKQETVDFLSKEVIKNLPRKDGLINLSHYMSVPVFVLNNHSLLISTRVDFLHHLYIFSYKNQYENFNIFLFKSLNQEIIFDEKYFTKYDFSIFKIDNGVKKKYETKKFIDFYNYYLKKEDKKEYLSRDKILDTNQHFSVIYYLFINNYYTTEDDYIGRTYVHNWNEITSNNK
ncbi:hypothetical protein [Flavobacterium psychrophilum]|uniref:Uncharacterized protein n=1 Tax=Flavobacterium psychrophilum TaxID=96345 RepID=A0A7U2R9I7_FLAPS|nr:hypothetical protein [Flavobacterium psychrophilum]QRE04038.1 hypothetical protein H0H26_00030 [Flavobacterium psychrophilum]